MRLGAVSGQYSCPWKYPILIKYSTKAKWGSKLSRNTATIMPHLVKLLMFYAIKLQFIQTNNKKLAEIAVGIFTCV